MFNLVRNHQSSEVAVPFCIPPSREWEFLLRPTFPSLWPCQCSGLRPLSQVRSGVSELFHLCFPDDVVVEHLITCLFAICMSSLVRCLLRALAHF